MIKTIQSPVEGKYQLVCDATKVELQEVALSNANVLGCTITFNTNYGTKLDGLNIKQVHLSENVVAEMLKWVDQKYPDAGIELRIISKLYKQ